jgi:hypothetical protein
MAVSVVRGLFRFRVKALAGTLLPGDRLSGVAVVTEGAIETGATSHAPAGSLPKRR